MTTGTNTQQLNGVLIVAAEISACKSSCIEVEGVQGFQEEKRPETGLDQNQETETERAKKRLRAEVKIRQMTARSTISKGITAHSDVRL